MYRNTLAQIKTISQYLADPPRAERVMHNRLLSSVKLSKKVITRDLLSVLCKHKVGTNDVNRCVTVLCRNSENYKRRLKILYFLMKDKMDDADREVKRARNENLRMIKEYKKVIKEGEIVDLSFREILKRERDKVWSDGKKKNQRKIEFMMKRKQQESTRRRKKSMENEEDSKGIKYKDTDLDEIGREKNEETYVNKPKVYGGVEISDEVETFLSKDLGFMVYDKIDALNVEVEIEKGITKTRYEMMNRDEEDEEECNNDQTRSNKQNRREEKNKILNYSNLRATDIPTVPRLIEPEKATLKQEIVMETTKQKLLDTLNTYMTTHCDKNGEIKEFNLSPEEKKNLKEVKKDIKDKNIVVFTTDKSGKFSVDSPTNYEKAVHKHTEKDVEVKDGSKIKQIENKMNQHMRQLNKIFQVGKSNDQEHRVTAATISSNTPAPPMYGLRKDHKRTENEMEGPPVRPVCGAKEAPNSRLSHFLSRILNDFCNVAEIETECRSGEEMKAAFEKFNREEDDDSRKKCRVISMDVRALYPSMEWDEIEKAVRELVETSEKQVEEVDWNELGKYLAVMMSEDEIRKEKLKTAIPRREGESNRKITIAYLCNKQYENKWIPAKQPSQMQKKRMVAITVAKAVRTCIENHTYRVGDRIYHQQEGGPIGLELTGAVSRAFMKRWDRLYLEKAKKAGVKMKLYERYVDDSNQVAEVPPHGTKLDRETMKIVMDPNKGQEDEKEDDERLAEVLKDIANSIMPCIQMEADWPSKNEDGKLPILDLKVWTSNSGNILYTHYEKPMASKSILHTKSAHTESCKRSVHTQEVLRRIMNCSKQLDWGGEVAPVVTEYMYRMKRAGYKENYRNSILKSALRIYHQKQKDEEEGVRPMFRPKDWKRKERDKAKRNKRTEWATKRGHTAPIFVPATPGGKLAKMMRQVADKEADEGVHFNIVEMSGRRLKAELQRSNPTATPGCGKEDCIACKEGAGKGGNCRRGNINYEIECKLCPKSEPSAYIGETSRNLYTRTLEHMGNKDGEGFINKHMEECHPGQEKSFVARVTRSNRDCLTRQIMEGVSIRRSKKNLLNTKTEWFQPPLFRIQSEVLRE